MLLVTLFSFTFLLLFLVVSSPCNPLVTDHPLFPTRLVVLSTKEIIWLPWFTPPLWSCVHSWCDVLLLVFLMVPLKSVSSFWLYLSLQHSCVCWLFRYLLFLVPSALGKSHSMLLHVLSFVTWPRLLTRCDKCTETNSLHSIFSITTKMQQVYCKSKKPWLEVTALHVQKQELRLHPFFT